MKKVIIGTLLGLLSLSVLAEDVVITSGVKGMTYHSVYGMNLGKLLAQYKYHVTLQTSKGSLDNADKVADATIPTIGFTQADAYASWLRKHPEKAGNVEIAGKLGKECAFVAVKANGKISNEDGLTNGIKIAVGNIDSGSAASWEYMKQLVKDYTKTNTSYEGGTSSLAKVATGELDAFLWISAPDTSNKYFSLINSQGSGLKVIGMDDWNMNDKLPDGSQVYEKSNVVVKKNTFSDDEVKTACTETLVIRNNLTSDELNDDLASMIIGNKMAITGSK